MDPGAKEAKNQLAGTRHWHEDHELNSTESVQQTKYARDASRMGNTHVSGHGLNKRPTGVATNKPSMCRLQTTHGGEHSHARLLGGNHTPVAENYPAELAETFDGSDDVCPIDDDWDMAVNTNEPQQVDEPAAEDIQARLSSPAHFERWRCAACTEDLLPAQDRTHRLRDTSTTDYRSTCSSCS